MSSIRRIDPVLALRRAASSGPVASWCLAFLVALSLAPSALAATKISSELGDLSRKLLANRTPERYRSLEAFAGQAAGAERAFALYSLGMARYADKRYADAEQALSAALGKLGEIDHYAAYYRVRCIVLVEDFERSLGSLEAFLRDYPGSRFRPAAMRLRVESLLRLRRWAEARTLVQDDGGPLEEPVRLYLAGRVEHLDGNLQEAVSLYRQAYYRFPSSDQAQASERQLDGLRARMGEAYPAAPAAWRLDRAEKLRAGRKYADASAEFRRALAAGLTGTDRDRAIVHRGAADYARRSSTAAYAALAKARPKDPALDAERLYLLSALERRKRLVQQMHSSVAKLAVRHKGSAWYEEALLTVGNYYYLQDDRKEYPQWFRRLAEAFPKGEHAPYAHWKVCWRAWLDDSGERRKLLGEHVTRFPASATASAAMYWLARLNDEEGRGTEAQGLYRAIIEAFPHHYYGFLASRELDIPGAKVPPWVAEALPSARKLDSEPSAATRATLELAGALATLGFDTDASEELRRADYRKSDAHFVGRELGRLHSRRDEHFLAVRAMKRYAFGYLRFPMETLDDESWRYLFPIGWEDSLRARSKRHGLDPYLVAALIRQESEFNPGARSSAGALGLMQVMPATGRHLFRRLGIPGFSNRKLTIPDVSLRLGTFHLKNVLAEFEGELEKALAGYNAGERRIPQWMALGPFDDAAEFVETIPFSETRGYVQSIIRNREMYQRIYGN